MGDPQCLTYDAPAVLSGFLIRGILPGRPNFEDVQRGDARTQVSFLLLDTPFCVRAQANTPDAAPPYGMVQVVHLAWERTPSQQQLEALAGRTIRLRGIVAHAETAHHRTRVWLHQANLAP